MSNNTDANITLDFIISSLKVKEIWANSKPKNALLEHLQWYFRPKSSYDVERVDYNALNILAEY